MFTFLPYNNQNQNHDKHGDTLMIDQFENRNATGREEIKKWKTEQFEMT